MHDYRLLLGDDRELVDLDSQDDKPTSRLVQMLYLYMQKGFISFIPLLLIGIITSLGVIYISNAPTETRITDATSTSAPIVIPTTEPTREVTPSPTPSPSPIPTLSPISVPTKTPAPTVQPTQTPASVSGPPSAGHSRYTIGTEAGSFLIDVVSLPASAQMITDTANDNDCTADCPVIPLADYVARNGAYAGINGTYFCPTDYADCASKKNSYDFPVYNSRLSKWLNATNLFWNNRSMVLKNGGLSFLRNANSYGGGGSAGIVNHPGVLDNGNVIANDMGPNGAQTSKGTRGGIGFNSSNIYLVIARNASVQDLGFIFKALGATNAMNLDGGGSVALWYGGYKVGPGRALPNAIVFK